ncbi:hypothetical protein Ntsu_02200 [Nocardia sp. IFM 10818]
MFDLWGGTPTPPAGDTPAPPQGLAPVPPKGIRPLTQLGGCGLRGGFGLRFSELFAAAQAL